MVEEAIVFIIGDGNAVARNSGMSVSEFTKRAEKLGYDGVTIGVGGMGYGTGYDPFTFLGQVAMASNRLLLCTSIFVLPLAHPLIVAQQVATLDALSQGRLIFGVGLGGERPTQFQNLGIPVSERSVRTNEAIEILKGLWTQPVFSYHGRIFHFDDISLAPRPVQKPHPPILIAGRIGGVEIGPDGKTRYKSRTAAMRRAALYGDGWMPYYVDPAMYRESVKQIKAYAAEFGRENHSFTWSHNLFFAIRDTYDEAVRATEGAVRQGAVRGRDFTIRYDILGSPKDCIKRMEEYVDAGVRHFVLKPVLHEGDIHSSARELAEQMELLAQHVIPYFK